jgi:cobyrinic acid a,c-diamide synthase
VPGEPAPPVYRLHKKGEGVNRLLICAAHKSSGKTTVSIGLGAALSRRGLAVQPFKKGPDYIDPLWLTQACGRACHNLDFYLMPPTEIRATFATRSAGANISMIEGNKGLYDGLDLDGSNSNAALATLLKTPVVLVIDARGMTRGIAPLILGYQAFDKNVNIAGVILNQLGGARHESKLRAVIEHYTDVAVLGAVHQDKRLAIAERHLGLIPSNEASEAQARIDAIAALVAEQVDLDKVLRVASNAPALTDAPTVVTRTAGVQPDIRLGVVRDSAFGFYYPGDLEALQQAGAKLIFIDALRDATVPDVDGLFIGGGFPETHLEKLEANKTLRQDIARAIDAGLPTYAECGGLMYLSRRIVWNDKRGEMVGVIPADTVMHDKPQGRGYVTLRETGRQPWPAAGSVSGNEIRAHEFHYSRLENIDPNLVYAYDVVRGFGVDGKRDGIVYKNLLACYTHRRHLTANPWCSRFIEFVRHHKSILPRRAAS